MNANKPLKAQIIERSLNCFAYGLVGLVPGLGIPFAIVALQEHWRVKRDGVGMWNPARTYLKWGIICARLSLAISLILVASIVLLVSFDTLFSKIE
jgi:hypothetical protein